MKTPIQSIAVLLVSCFAFTFCSENKSAENTENPVKDLRSYVDSVNQAAEIKDNWQNIEMRYNEKADKVEVATKENPKNEELKAEYDKVKSDYAALKVKYEQQQAKMFKRKLRDALFGEGIIGQDMAFGFMNSTNAAGVYERFVNGVAANKDIYTREDWDEVKVLYEAMDTRKNEIEKDLAGSDNRKIAGLKVRFATMKAMNRPGSKIDENNDAKTAGGK